MSSSRGAGVASVVALLAFHVLFFSRAYTTSDTFFLRDYTLVQTPVKELALASLRGGELPLWLPSLSGGQPLLANPNYFLFHPGNFLPLFFGIVPGLKAFLLLQYLLASGGAFLLARRFQLSLPAALLCAVSFAYGGFLCSLGNLLNSLATAALLPWLLLATDRLVRGGRGGLLAVTAIAALQVFSGEPVPGALTWLLALGLAGARSQFGTLGPRVGRTALGLGLGLLVASPQALPALLFFRHSDRAGGLGAAAVLKWSLPPVRLLETLFPEILGSTAWVAPPAYLGGPWESDGYPYILNVFLGPVVLLLAALAAISVPRARPLVLAGCVAAVAALGSHLPGAAGLVDLAPALAIFRYPSKLLLVTSICFALAAGRGLDHLRGERPRHADGVGFGGLAVALAAALALPRLTERLVGAATQSPATADAATVRILGPGYLVVVILGATALLLLGRGRQLMGGATAGWILLGLQAATILWFMPGLLPMVPRSFHDSVPPPVAAIVELQEDTTERIYWEHPDTPLNLPRHPQLSPDAQFPGHTAEMAFGQRQLGMEFIGRRWGLEYAFEPGWEGVTLTSIRRSLDALPTPEDPTWRRRLDDAGVRYVLGFARHPELPLLRTFEGLEQRPLLLQENPTALPLVTPAARAQLIARSQTRWEIAVAEPGAVRIAANGYPLWTALAGDRSLPITSAPDEAEVVVEVPAGVDRFVLTLDPWALRLGFVLSAVGMAIALLLSRRWG